MTNADKKKPQSAADIRKAKLAKELRANLMRRKEQARARRSGDEDQRTGLATSSEPEAGN